MKINEIIFEDNKPHKNIRRSSEVSILEAIDFIRSNCSEITNIYKKNKDVRLYRGMPSGSDFRFGDTSIRTRRSKNTENYYTMVMDNDPIWKKFPKRSESFICSTDKSYATDYGKIYLVFPVNGTKIGQCPGRDIWDISIKKTGEMLDEFNNFILELQNISKTGLSQYDYNLFRSKLKIVQNMYNKNPKFFEDKFPSYLLNKKVKQLLSNNYNNFYKMFLDVISPEDFKLWTTKNFDVKNKHECWFSGKCIFVNVEHPISMGPDSVSTYMKNKKAGNPDTKDLNISEFIEAL